MNNYITINDGTNSYKYKTAFRSWRPSTIKPTKSRVLLNGKLDIAYGSDDFPMWEGEIIAPVTSPGAGWGTIATLRTQLARRVTYSFTDHYGTNYPITAIEGQFKEESLQPVWDGTENEMLVMIMVKSEP